MKLPALERPEKVLELRGIGRQYGADPAVHALVDIDLSLYRGDWLSIPERPGVRQFTLGALALLLPLPALLFGPDQVIPAMATAGPKPGASTNFATRAGGAPPKRQTGHFSVSV